MMSIRNLILLGSCFLSSHFSLAQSAEEILTELSRDLCAVVSGYCPNPTFEWSLVFSETHNDGQIVHGSPHDQQITTNGKGTYQVFVVCDGNPDCYSKAKFSYPPTCADCKLQFNSPVTVPVTIYQIAKPTKISDGENHEVLGEIIPPGVDYGSKVFPNPTISFVTLSMDSPRKEEALIMIRDINGAILIEARYDLVAGANAVEFDLSAFASGMYVVSWYTAHYQDSHLISLAK